MYRVRSNRWLESFTILPLLALAALGWSHIARADAVLDWNAIAADTVSKAAPPRPVPVSFLDMAVVQAAVYDAVEAIGGKFKPYQVQIPGASGSPEAAAAKAAHDVLINIFPPQAAPLDTAYRDYLAKKGLAEDDPGVAVGQKAAAGILALRANDGRLPNPPPPPFAGDNATGVAPDHLLPTPAAALRRTDVGAVARYRPVFHIAKRRPIPRQTTTRSEQSTIHGRL